MIKIIGRSKDLNIKELHVNQSAMQRASNITSWRFTYYSLKYLPLSVWL